VTVAERYIANGPSPLFRSSRPMPMIVVKTTRPRRSIIAACSSSYLRLARLVDVRVGLLAVVAHLSFGDGHPTAIDFPALQCRLPLAVGCAEDVRGERAVPEQCVDV